MGVTVELSVELSDEFPGSSEGVTAGTSVGMAVGVSVGVTVELSDPLPESSDGTAVGVSVGITVELSPERSEVSFVAGTPLSVLFRSSDGGTWGASAGRTVGVSVGATCPASDDMSGDAAVVLSVATWAVVVTDTGLFPDVVAFVHPRTSADAATTSIDRTINSLFFNLSPLTR